MKALCFEIGMRLLQLQTAALADTTCTSIMDRVSSSYGLCKGTASMECSVKMTSAHSGAFCAYANTFASTRFLRSGRSDLFGTRK